VSEQKHTPGPWVAEDNEIHAAGQMIAVALYNGHSDAEEAETESNARLMAAAPEMLAALKGLMDGWTLPPTVNEYWLIQDGHDPTEARKICNAVLAIAKAEGKQ
jgi:hypothetical protein